MDDKRRVQRLSMELPVSFREIGLPHEVSLGTTFDISATGLGIKTREMLAPGQELILTITLSDGRKLTMDVKVVWLRVVDFYTYADYAVGLRISEAMQRDEAAFVKFFVRELMKRSADKKAG